MRFRNKFAASTVPPRLFALLFAILMLVASPVTVMAQGPGSFWIPPTDLEDRATAPEDSASAATHTGLSLIVDTDPGVDDALALIWLFSQTETPIRLRGIVTVAGNTTVENATKNTLTVLDKLNRRHVNVVMGADKPLSEKLSSTGKLIHGKDGLWGLQEPQNLWRINRDARKFYCDTAKRHPGTTIVALGPLTNIAEAIRRCERDMQSISRIVVLGGAKFGGNTTPVAEFNIWQDPKAAQIVFASGIDIDQVPLDAFTQLTFSDIDLGALAGSALPAVQYLFPAVALYAGVQLQAAPAASIPDLAAMIYALQGLGTATSGLVKVVDDPDLVRGQTVIGLNFSEKATMIASDREMSRIADDAFAISEDPVFPDFDYIFLKLAEILAREPDNAQVVMDIFEDTMRTEALATLTAAVAATATNVEADPAEDAQVGDTIFLPSVEAD